jgi:cyclopropane-fatty-acyl-phospholipid synthase
MSSPIGEVLQQTEARGAPGGICQRIIFKALQKMTLGFFEFEMPDGTMRMVGDPRAAIRARARVVDYRFFKQSALFGDIGFGESYVNGDWETDDIASVVSWFILNQENSPAQSGSTVGHLLINFFQFWNRLHHLLRPNTVETSRRNIAEHYDLGNDFYGLWLDPTMTYSSALFTAPDQSLEDAQRAKYEALCTRLRLVPGDRVLEIGSGWGGFACHAARHYGCHVTTVTISRTQYEYAKARCAREGVADRVQIRLQDYREIEGEFDKIVSIEMMEALGDRYLEIYFRKIHSLLTRDGLVALQYITVPDSRHRELRRGVDWIQKHIFPGSLLLSVGRVNEAVNRTGDLSLFEMQDLGDSYARTLKYWSESFNAQREAVRALGFDERFIRKWNYYLSYCEAAFAMRNISVVQAVYARPNSGSLRLRVS